MVISLGEKFFHRLVTITRIYVNRRVANSGQPVAISVSLTDACLSVWNDQLHCSRDDARKCSHFVNYSRLITF